MVERPILFSAPMVRTILAGQKTQTRRAWREQPPAGTRVGWVPGQSTTPYGKEGDRLWVRETWAAGKCADGLSPNQLHPGTWTGDNGGLWYPADDREPTHPISPRGKTRASIHMPRWASRITLEITGVRVERLQAISEADAMAEGAEPILVPPDGGSCPHVEGFEALWSSINGRESWDANPWVWVVSFRRVEAAC